MRHLMWFRSDLRLRDNPALAAACREAADGVIGVFTLCPAQWRDEHDWGAPKTAFVLGNVRALSAALAERHIPLRILTLDRFDEVPGRLVQLARELDCGQLFFNAEYEWNERLRDEAVGAACAEAGLAVVTRHDQSIVPPRAIATGTGDFYSVFSPYRRRWLDYVRNHGTPTPLNRPRSQTRIDVDADPLPAGIVGVEMDEALAERWPAGEAEAERRLARFLDEPVGAYHRQRDRPAVEGTSGLSPYLAAGVISARHCFRAAYQANGRRYSGGRPGVESWMSELLWRDFYRHVLVGWPRLSKRQAFRSEVDAGVPWSDDRDAFEAWAAGRTGYPIVDAGMRQLATMAWMHNRLRMIVAMFLTKHLLIDWRHGERWFMNHLVDGDLASNNGGWQWSASTGTDAAPYFRIFNPTEQSRKHDPDGAFIRRWVPELAEVEAPAIHDPPPDVRRATGYPRPIVDHQTARARALRAFKAAS